MRPILALLVLGGATSAQAQVAQDRYGPPRPPSPPPMVVASLNAAPPVEPYRGPMLRWASKPAESDRAQPVGADQPAKPGPAPAYLPPSAPLPPSLFAPPAPHARSAKPYGPEAMVAPAPAHAAPAQPVARAQPERPQAAQTRPAAHAAQARPAQPSVQATAQPPAPAQPARLAAAPATPHAVGAAPRFYSLHREYGMAPDHIPEQPSQPRYVLIGPPDAPKPPVGDDDNDEKAPATKSNAVF